MKLKIPYRPLLLGPAIMFGLGYIFNTLAMLVNNNQMPVYIPGGCNSEIMDRLFSHDLIHSCMNHSTHLKLFSDWLIVGTGVASPGDFLIWSGQSTAIPFVVAWFFLVFTQTEY